MTARLSPARTRSLRMRANRLTGPRATDARAVVAALCGVQAQDERAARLALRARSRGLDAHAVEQACWEERSLVRTWALRGTLHLLAAEDVHWIVGLLGPLFARAGRPRRLALGLDDELCERALAALRGILGGERSRTRAELVRRLVAEGVAVEQGGQAPAHLVAYAALRGVVCHGPPRADGSPTYVLRDEWLGPQRAVEPERSLAELARRYLRAHGPAGHADLAAWSGIGLRRAREAFGLVAPELQEVEVAGERAWTPSGAAHVRGASAGATHVALLGHFDPYLLGYRNRDLVLDARHARRIQAGGGFIQPALLVDGHVAGTPAAQDRRARAGGGAVRRARRGRPGGRCARGGGHRALRGRPDASDRRDVSARSARGARRTEIVDGSAPGVPSASIQARRRRPGAAASTSRRRAR